MDCPYISCTTNRPIFQPGKTMYSTRQIKILRHRSNYNFIAGRFWDLLRLECCCEGLIVQVYPFQWILLDLCVRSVCLANLPLHWLTDASICLKIVVVCLFVCCWLYVSIKGKVVWTSLPFSPLLHLTFVSIWIVGQKVIPHATINNTVNLKVYPVSPF